MKPETLNAGLAVAHLYRRFPCPEFFAAHELDLSGLTPGSTGSYGVGRRADFVALRLWGNRPGHLLGFEVKVSRSDFVHELAQPDKRHPLESLCSACYFVAPSHVLNAAELPEGWGWIELNGAGLRMRREAMHRKLENSASVYHRLMKRLIDNRWHDRARRPALQDWPKEVFRFAGKDITPGQLEALALEVFSRKADDLRLEGRAAARKEGKEDARLQEETISKYETAICALLGISRWTLSSIPTDELSARLQAAASGNPAALSRAVSALEDVERYMGSVTRSMVKLRERLIPPVDAAPTE